MVYRRPKYVDKVRHCLWNRIPFGQSSQKVFLVRKTPNIYTIVSLLISVLAFLPNLMLSLAKLCFDLLLVARWEVQLTSETEVSISLTEQ